MSYHPDDTICAIATAAGGAERGMVRVSGPDAIELASKVVRAPREQPLDSLRRPTAAARELLVELDGAIRQLPCDVFTWPTHRSYTREPVVELHTLGSPPLLEALLAAVCAAGARLAEPGEFTLRAFLAGRIDLTQAEAVLGVIDAHAADDLSTALAQMAGGLSKPLQHLRDELLQLLAELEAGLDFVEDGIEFVSREKMVRRLDIAAHELSKIQDQMASRYAQVTDKQVVLYGRPNVGKSSLFNALVMKFGRTTATDRRQAAAAIVSPQRGTTRDYLTATIYLDEIQCEIVDTAGVEQRAATTFESVENHISATAEEFTERRRKSATVRLACVEAPVNCQTNELAANLHDADGDVIVVTKGDLLRGSDLLSHWQSKRPLVVTSSADGTGLEELKNTLRSLLSSERTAQHGQAVGATANRCQASIGTAQSAITRATELATAEMGNELVAEELRTALDELGKVVGTVYTDDLLDRIFSTFCIGK
jgi:tRNA modification GTPase